MNRLLKSYLPALGAAGVVLAGVTEAAAWDAYVPDQVVTRLRPSPSRPFPFTATRFNSPSGGRDQYFFYTSDHQNSIAHSSQNGTHRYGFKFVHEALGGPVGATGEPISPGFLFCRDRPTDHHLEKYRCEPWRGTTLDDRQASHSWVMARKAWVDNDPTHAGAEHNEHATLARHAAHLSGLPPTLGETFFVRYPAPNRLIVSQVEEGWIVGPSAVPLDQDGESSSTLRSFNLYELTQIPDWSFSVADWVASNETCPLNRIPGGFPDSPNDPGNLRCHLYATTIGPLNATHFLPASSSVYGHYHQLALQRMGECNALAVGLAGYYSELEGRALVWSPNDTEAHECEREAMIYEMFAQHFLQDAWATGHMWHRWGYAEPSKFPATLDDRYGRQWDDPALVPPENDHGRRALLAATVAAFVGMIHGTKAVTAKLVPRAVANYGLVDDPLNAPYFDNYPFLPKKIRWQDIHGFTAPGVGDLWAGVATGGEDEYSPWRDRFLSCSAKSMRQVYQAGPKAHGPLISYLAKGDPEDFTSFYPDCFSQRATNESMLGSVLPVPLAYHRELSDIPIGPSVFAVSNNVTLKAIEEMAALPNEADRAKFLAAIRKRMLLDQQSVVFDYLANRSAGLVGNRDGTESAQGRVAEATSVDGRIKFLGVPPNELLTDSPPAPFMDRTAPVVPEENFPDSYFLRRMFWRAHPEDSCEESGLVARLKDACVAGASQPGGDPEACTRCVALAELQMPGCTLTGSENSPSKCEALGLQSNGGIDPRYLTEQCATELGENGSPASFLAFRYCTGTKTLPFREHLFEGSAVLTGGQTTEVDCPKYAPSDPFVSKALFTPWSTQRIAVSIFENENATETGQPEVPTSSFLSRLVNVVERTTSTSIYDEAVYCRLSKEPNDFYLSGAVVESTLDDLYRAQIAPLSLWDNQSKGVHALAPFANSPNAIDELMLEQCGVTQRVSYHNRDCSAALAAIGRSDLSDQVNLGYNSARGTEVTFAIGTGESRCSIREEPKLRPVCARGSCNANGLCSSQDPPEVIRFH